MKSPGGRVLLLVIAGAVILACLAAGLLRPEWPAQLIQRALDNARGAGPVGWAGYIVLQSAVAASGILPASLLGIAAGAMYGVPLGFTLAALSTFAGALLAFALSRSLFRGLVARLLSAHPRFRRFDTLLSHDGWRIVCLLRLSPVMPFAATSYALGMSAIGGRAYCLGTLASMPALLGYVVLGKFSDAGLTSWSNGASGMHWALLAIGIAATAGLTLLVGRIARRAAASQ